MSALSINIDLFKKNVLEDEHLLFPYKICTDWDLPKERTYNSPTLLILFKKLTYVKNQQEINFD